MFSKSKTKAPIREREYATCRDFKQIFTEDMAGLHQLAYLLTADKEKAEACFVAGLDESIHGNPVYKEWARAWSKRAIIQNAIKTITPSPRTSIPAGAIPDAAGGNDAEHSLVVAVASWPVFERFVFVMAVLEGYSLRECSALLSCPVQEVVAAKTSALQRLGELKIAEAAGARLKTSPWPGIFARVQVA